MEAVVYLVICYAVMPVALYFRCPVADTRLEWCLYFLFAPALVPAVVALCLIGAVLGAINGSGSRVSTEVQENRGGGDGAGVSGPG